MPYTEISQTEVAEIASLAGLSDLLSIENLSGGWANSNYLLNHEDGSKSVLKIWNERTPNEADEVIKITTWLSENGIPTADYLKLQNDEKMIVKDNLAWTIMPFVGGGWLKSDEKNLLTLGEVQAKMHLLDTPDFLTSEFSMGGTLFKKLFDYADENAAWDEFLLMLKENWIKISHHLPENLPRGVIHGDLFPDNVIGSQGEVKAILDFEEACEGWLAFDLMMTFVGFGWENGEPVPSRWMAILAGYESVRPLEKDEVRSLNDLHRLATLSIAAWRYWQFVINIPGTEHTNRYLEMVERLDKPLPF